MTTEGFSNVDNVILSDIIKGKKEVIHLSLLSAVIMTSSIGLAAAYNLYIMSVGVPLALILSVIR